MDHQRKEILKELSQTREQFWNIGKETASFIHSLIILRNIKTALEIGTSNGYSGIVIADALEKNNGELFTIESHKTRFSLAQENFKRANLRNITQINGHAPEDIPENPKKFDLVFLDATKKEHLNYFHSLKDRLNPNGIILGDNVQSHREKMLNYIEEVKKNPQFTTVELSIGTGLLISFKN